MKSVNNSNYNNDDANCHLAFYAEINYVILLALKQLYDRLIKSYIRINADKQFVNDEIFVSRQKKVDDYYDLYDRIRKTVKEIENQNLFPLRGWENLNEKISPNDYPLKTLDFLSEYLSNSDNRRELINSYGNIRFDKNKAERVGCLIKETLIEHIKLTQEIPFFSEKENGILGRIHDLWMKDSIDEWRNSAYKYTEELKKSAEFITGYMVLLGGKNYETALELLNFRLLYIYFFNLHSLYKITHNTDQNSEFNTAFFYNIEQNNSNMVKYDAWLLGKSYIDPLIKRKEIMYGIELASADEQASKENREKIIKLLLDDGFGSKAECLYALCNVPGLIDKVNKSDEIKKIRELVNQNILALFDLYNSYDLRQVNIYDNFEVYKKVIREVGYCPVEISEGDRLDLERCQSLEVEDTNEISLNFIIKEVYQTGMYYKKELIRKSLVCVYRYKID